LVCTLTSATQAPAKSSTGCFDISVADNTNRYVFVFVSDDAIKIGVSIVNIKCDDLGEHWRPP
jgi:hypothetical protein